MDLSEAFKKAIKAYWKDDEYENMESWNQKKYNKKYFKSVRSEMLNKVDEEDDE